MISIRKKSVTAIIFLTILCLSTSAYASTQTAIPGVKAGDSFSYSITTHWNTTNSSLTSPPGYLVYNNQTKYYNVTVLYVEDVNVVAMNLWELNNGTQKLSRVDMNVGNGTLYLVTGEMCFQGFFPANMNTDDLIRPDGNSSLSINSTETREYASGARNTNVLSYSYQVRDYYNTSIGTETTTFYIDQATGILVKRIDQTTFPDQNGLLEWTLTATNLWIVSSQPSFVPVEVIVIAAVSIVVAIVSLVFYSKYRRH